MTAPGTGPRPRSGRTWQRCVRWSPTRRPTCSPGSRTGTGRRSCGRHSWSPTTTPTTSASWSWCAACWAAGRKRVDQGDRFVSPGECERFIMPDADAELDELRGRVARLEVAVASVEFETSFWGRVLRLLSVAAIAFVVMLVSPWMVTWFWALLGLRP